MSHNSDLLADSQTQISAGFYGVGLRGMLADWLSKGKRKKATTDFTDYTDSLKYLALPLRLDLSRQWQGFLGLSFPRKRESNSILSAIRYLLNADL
jgi:hypothetical protein